MALSGTWAFQETWTVGGKQFVDNFDATFNEDGTVTITPNAGFKLVWYTGTQPGAQAVVFAGDNSLLSILAAYYGTIASGNTTMSGNATGRMGVLPVTGTWTATRTATGAGK